VAGNGRWISLALKRPKKKGYGGTRNAKKVIQQVKTANTTDDGDGPEDDEDPVDADADVMVNEAPWKFWLHF
jgi:hypothetical protein